MISLVDGNVHGAAEACQLSGSGVWYHDDVQVGRSASHGRVVLQHEVQPCWVESLLGVSASPTTLRSHRRRTRVSGRNMITLFDFWALPPRTLAMALPTSSECCSSPPERVRTRR